MKEYKHIGQTLHPDTGEFCLQTFSDNTDRALIDMTPMRAFELAEDLLAYAKRYMVPIGRGGLNRK
jgi:hypothetical protein